jgi:hypothetical protein
MAVRLVAYLMSVGHTPTFAAAVAGLLGILSVAGRLAMAGLTRRRTVTTVTATVFATQGIALAGLILIGRSEAGAVASVAAFGLGFGMATIARPAIVAERYGVIGYATLAGYLVVMAVIAAACLTAAVCLAALPASERGRARLGARGSSGPAARAH